MLVKDIEIKNKDIIKILDRYVALQEIDGWHDAVRYCMKEKWNKESADYYTGPEYLRKVKVVEGSDHEGFPDHMVAINFKPNDPDVMPDTFKHDAPPDIRKYIMDEVYDITGELNLFLGTRNNALLAFYPKDGYISWHNNWNAPGFNLIFSWSETGDGWFKHVEPKTGEVVHHQDKPGWQLKAGYFGHHEQPDKICYHAARTNCRRITVSFIFSLDDMAMNLQDDVIEEISQE